VSLYEIGEIEQFYMATDNIPSELSIYPKCEFEKVLFASLFNST